MSLEMQCEAEVIINGSIKIISIIFLSFSILSIIEYFLLMFLGFKDAFCSFELKFISIGGL